MTINYYAPFGDGTYWRNITDLDDTTYGQIAIIDGKRKLVVGDKIGELCLVGGKRRYWVEAEEFISGCIPIIITFMGKTFHLLSTEAGVLNYAHHSKITLYGGNDACSDITTMELISVFELADGVVSDFYYSKRDSTSVANPDGCSTFVNNYVNGEIVDGVAVASFRAGVYSQYYDGDDCVYSREEAYTSAYNHVATYKAFNCYSGVTCTQTQVYTGDYDNCDGSRTERANQIIGGVLHVVDIPES